MEDADNFLLTQPDSRSRSGSGQARPVRVLCFPEKRHVEVNVVMHVQRSVMPGEGSSARRRVSPALSVQSDFFPSPSFVIPPSEREL